MRDAPREADGACDRLWRGVGAGAREDSALRAMRAPWGARVRSRV